jgi:hypothetical protein
MLLAPIFTPKTERGPSLILQGRNRRVNLGIALAFAKGLLSITERYQASSKDSKSVRPFYLFENDLTDQEIYSVSFFKRAIITCSHHILSRSKG